LIRAALITALLALPTALFAEPPKLSLPIDCTLGKTCFIQQYVDDDPGGTARDYTCGPLSYQGHKGTDIRVAFRRQINGSGIAVKAAAGGRVQAMRDRLPDIAQGSPNAPDITGVECGNGVLLDHGDGWQTLYCHMRRGSIQVRAGQMVNRGDALGLVGLSGNSAFPHVHIQVLHNRRVIDPFHPASRATCGDETAQLWVPPIVYEPGGILAAGFATSPIGFKQIKQGPPMLTSVSKDAAALTVWGYFFGLQKDDIVTIRVLYPEGETMINRRFAIKRNRAVAYRLTGKRRRDGPWSSGRYSADITLIRNKKIIAKRSVYLQVK